MFLSMNDFSPGCLFALVVIKCFTIGVNVMSVTWHHKTFLMQSVY